MKHQKHEIHKVDCNSRLVLVEENIYDFAVKLTMGDQQPAMETFRGETERFIEQLQGRRGLDIKMSDLIDEKNRITLVTAVAGSGKSVLVKQLVLKWANGELFDNFKVCITFECRELNYFALNEGKRLEKHEMIIEFIKGKFGFNIKDSKEIFFVIDGCDELYDVAEKVSVIGQLLDLKKTNYPQSKIIITGRPHIENMLLDHGGRNMGGLQKVEIIGLSDEQIQECIRKFASANDDMIRKINKAKDSSKDNLKLLHNPQMLQSFCCVVVLSELTGIKNAAELYCWSFYLLLKQHAEKNGSSDKKIPDIFKEYSKDLLALGKICHELLNKNTIIFEGNIECSEIGKGKEFLEGLFVNVSDDFQTKNQFKHLTLMEFLSAVYVCAIKNPTEIIKDILSKRLDQVLLFNCQLIAGLMYNGIIKEMFKNAANLKEVDCEDFFHLILTLVRECVTEERDESFRLSINVLMCLMNKDVINKHFILSIVNQLRFKNVKHSSDKLTEMMKGLSNDFRCTDGELKKAFENVHFGSFKVTEVNCLKFAKFVASVELIILGGQWTMITTTVKCIWISISKCRNLSRVWILNCTLRDEDLKEEIKECPKLEELAILDCDVSEQSFQHLCNLIITAKHVTLRGMKGEWWSMMLETIVRAKTNHDGDFVLRKLKIERCPLMNDEMKSKVITFILIHNHPNFIMICKWFNN